MTYSLFLFLIVFILIIILILLILAILIETVILIAIAVSIAILSQAPETEIELTMASDVIASSVFLDIKFTAWALLEIGLLGNILEILLFFCNIQGHLILLTSLIWVAGSVTRQAELFETALALEILSESLEFKDSLAFRIGAPSHSIAILIHEDLKGESMVLGHEILRHILLEISQL